MLRNIQSVEATDQDIKIPVLRAQNGLFRAVQCIGQHVLIDAICDGIAVPYGGSRHWGASKLLTKDVVTLHGIGAKGKLCRVTEAKVTHIGCICELTEKRCVSLRKPPGIVQSVRQCYLIPKFNA